MRENLPPVLTVLPILGADDKINNSPADSVDKKPSASLRTLLSAHPRENKSRTNIRYRLGSLYHGHVLDFAIN